MMGQDANREETVPPLNASTRLAYERTFLAWERTQMAWIRTALSLISFGFTISKFFDLLRQKQGESATLVGPQTVGVAMIAMGLFALAIASLQHFFVQKRMRKECPGLPRSLSWITAVLLALLGVGALVGALIRN